MPSAQQPLRSVLDGLGNYKALAGEAMYLDGQGAGQPGRPPAAALILYRQATDLLQGSILPSARSLTNQNTATLDAAYQAKRSDARNGALSVALCGAALLAVMVGMQQDMNGWSNYIPAAAAAFIIALVLAGVRPRLAEIPVAFRPSQLHQAQMRRGGAPTPPAP